MRVAWLAVVALIAACGDDAAVDGGAADTGNPFLDVGPLPDVSDGTPDRYRPPVGVRWYWQLDGELPAEIDAELVDVDLFDTSESAILAMHNAGQRVICYFSAGSWEDWRVDANGFPNAAIGEPLAGWPGERWLDTRHPDVRSRMIERLDLAQDKHCDGVEPDNVDGLFNETGFDLDQDDTVEYLAFLVDAARQRRLAIGLKNLPELAPSLEPLFDFALTESCVEFDECAAFAAFVSAGKAVLHVEYVDDAAQLEGGLADVCGAGQAASFSSAVATESLDGHWLSCE